MDQFHKDKSRKDGMERRCKPCVGEKNEKASRANGIPPKNRFECAEQDSKIRKRLYDKDYKLKNKEYMRDRNRIYANERRKVDLNFRLAHNIRSRIKKTIKAGSVSKNLGCSFDELRKYLESRFQTGMTWENYGVHGWHVDHILPLSKFNLENPDEFKKACHYTNLQPLWALDNIKRAIKYDL